MKETLAFFGVLAGVLVLARFVGDGAAAGLVIAIGIVSEITKLR